MLQEKFQRCPWRFAQVRSSHTSGSPERQIYLGYTGELSHPMCYPRARKNAKKVDHKAVSQPGRSDTISAETASWCSRKRINTWNKLCNKSGPTSKDLLKDWAWNFDVPIKCRRHLPGLFGLRTRIWVIPLTRGAELQIMRFNRSYITFIEVLFDSLSVFIF